MEAPLNRVLKGAPQLFFLDWIRLYKAANINARSYMKTSGKDLGGLNKQKIDFAQLKIITFGKT